MNGNMDDRSNETFAEREQQSMRFARKKEREAIVQWLKNRGIPYLNYAAQQIERGDHHKQEGK